MHAARDACSLKEELRNFELAQCNGLNETSCQNLTLVLIRIGSPPKCFSLVPSLSYFCHLSTVTTQHPPHCAFTYYETRTCLVYKRCHNCSQQPTTPWEKWNSAFRPHSSSVHRTQFRCGKYWSVQRRHGYQSKNPPNQFNSAMQHMPYTIRISINRYSVYENLMPCWKASSSIRLLKGRKKIQMKRWFIKSSVWMSGYPYEKWILRRLEKKTICL